MRLQASRLAVVLPPFPHPPRINRSSREQPTNSTMRMEELSPNELARQHVRDNLPEFVDPIDECCPSVIAQSIISLRRTQDAVWLPPSVHRGVNVYPWATSIRLNSEPPMPETGGTVLARC